MDDDDDDDDGLDFIFHLCLKIRKIKTLRTQEITTFFSFYELWLAIYLFFIKTVYKKIGKNSAKIYKI